MQIEIKSPYPVPNIKADRIGLEQVINNLLVNAIDAAAARSDGAPEAIEMKSHRMTGFKSGNA